MIEIKFDLDFDGKPDYITYRRVDHQDGFLGTNNSLMDFIISEQKTYPQFFIFAAKSGTGEYQWMVYYAMRYPLFYCLNIDKYGISHLIYKDLEEDGINGNEKIEFKDLIKPEREV